MSQNMRSVLEAEITSLEKQIDERNYSTDRPNNTRVYWGLRVQLDKKRDQLRELLSYKKRGKRDVINTHS